MSGRYDLLVRNAEVVAPSGVARADVGVADGRFARIGADLGGDAAETIDARGLHLFPGIVDSHVHFNEPGRTQWEGIATGSAALAAGGGTAFFDMPLNSLPPVCDAASFALKRAAAERSSRVDFALWGGLVPGNLDRLAELHEAGAVGFKAFLCDSGVDEFQAVDRSSLRAGMKRAAALGALVAVHAEDNALARRLAAEWRAKGTDVRAWLASRPVELETEAIRTAIDTAGEERCSLHIVHVSSPEGCALVEEARARGLDVTVETCPHYLLLTEEDVVRLGAPAKCCPILRSESNRLGLWKKMEGGAIDTLGSDHSPGPPEMKTAKDFFAVWGGISGCQHGFPLVISEALNRLPAGEALPRLAALMASHVARRFGMGGRKGAVAVGLDADFSLLSLGTDRRLSNAELLYRHRQGPYDGRHSRVSVERTVVRGRTVYAQGRIAPGAPSGQFMRPDRATRPTPNRHA